MATRDAVVCARVCCVAGKAARSCAVNALRVIVSVLRVIVSVLGVSVRILHVSMRRHLACC